MLVGRVDELCLVQSQNGCDRGVRPSDGSFTHDVERIVFL